jgi:hypothetical protein
VTGALSQLALALVTLTIWELTFRLLDSFSFRDMLTFASEQSICLGTFRICCFMVCSFIIFDYRSGSFQYEGDSRYLLRKYMLGVRFTDAVD